MVLPCSLDQETGISEPPCLGTGKQNQVFCKTEPYLRSPGSIIYGAWLRHEVVSLIVISSKMGIGAHVSLVSFC